ncbi:hypothetical protein [Pseudochryseolinea flava]|uniref:Uncharacterized protein n=1 Tax=Pseudochryseolinea flava TaxID=2059302 RepID=A0A364Y6Q3_9BACT|nr:hypothetical protein [Pseudochryseolinea flava]RAW02583.1 hypothetical protein DQQ10_00250 [Pseudochryseolinea flava]
MSQAYVDAITRAYEKINFISRFENILVHTDFANRLRKTDKKQVISILSELGYTFKVRTPGPEYVSEEVHGEFKFRFVLDVNGGIVLGYVYVFLNDEKIEFPYPNLVFTYKYLLNDVDRLMNPSTIFVDYVEMKMIVKDLLDIYSDFKVAFLKEALDTTNT